jgi:hypothetical protein
MHNAFGKEKKMLKSEYEEHQKYSIERPKRK